MKIIQKFKLFAFLSNNLALKKILHRNKKELRNTCDTKTALHHKILKRKKQKSHYKILNKKNYFQKSKKTHLQQFHIFVSDHDQKQS